MSSITWILLVTIMSFKAYSVETPCEIRTSKTKFDKYKIIEILKTRSIHICIDNKRFDSYDIGDFLKEKASITLYSSAMFDSYEIKKFAKLGSVSLKLNTIEKIQFDRYDIVSFLNEGVQVDLFEYGNLFDRYDVKTFLSKGRFSLIIQSHSTQFDRYDITNLASEIQKNSQAKITLYITDNKFDNYDISEFLKLGVIIKDSESQLYTTKQIVNSNSFTGQLRFANAPELESCQVNWASLSPGNLSVQLTSLTSPQLSRVVDVKIQNEIYKIQTPDFSQNFDMSLSTSYVAKYTKKISQDNDSLSAVYNVVLNTQRQEFEVYMQVLLKAASGQTAISAQKRILLCK